MSETEQQPKIDHRKLPRKRARKASHLLRVYRHVFETHQPRHANGKPKKEEPNIQLIREIKEKNPNQFLAKLQDLEKEYAASRGEEAEAVQMDTGSQKVLDLVEQLLDDRAKKEPPPRRTSASGPEAGK